MNAFSYFESPIGRLLLTSDGTALTGLYMEPSRKAQCTDGWIEDVSVAPLSATVRQLTEYFEGTRREFDLPLRLQGTVFQTRVWRELTEIPYGQTWSYGQLARRIDKPSASRAVGLANGRNPISILVPCHRVIGADGSLTGYGGGLERKQWLLAHEGHACHHRHLLGQVEPVEFQSYESTEKRFEAEVRKYLETGEL
jgi:methylated-DNA-[protein]-cysteine S-methyltransferase